MAWIKVDQTLLGHEKTFDLCERLEIDEPYGAIHVIALWMWAIDSCPDGILPENDRLIAKKCLWSGPAAPFVEALVLSGFVDEDRQGVRRIHDWDEWVGALLKSRRESAQRMQEWREQRKANRARR